MTMTSGRLLSRRCGPGLVMGAQAISFRCIGQNPGAGSRFSCLGPDFLATFYSPALFAFSDNIPLRHLSDRFSSVMSTLLECTGSFDETPAAFSRVIPSTKILPVEYSTRSTFPSSPANSPRIMRTLSPVLSGTRLILCLPVRSFESRAESLLRCLCFGAWKRSFLCFDGFELLILYITVEARLATLGHLSAASRATGPLISVPFISPSGVMITAALSSKESRVPSGLRNALACLTTTAGKTCFLRSGAPLVTETIIISPTQAAGTLRRRPWYPRTFISFSSFAPVLSAQVIREPTGRPLAILGLYSTIPRALTALVFGAGMSTLPLPSCRSLQRRLPC